MCREARRVDKRVVVVHAGRYGSTAEVAEVVAGLERRITAGIPPRSETPTPDA
jgi:menaquinone-dependent protoporphyrinogen IX oxidase